MDAKQAPLSDDAAGKLDARLLAWMNGTTADALKLVRVAGDADDPTVEVEVYLASAPSPEVLAELVALGLGAQIYELAYHAAVTRHTLVSLAAHAVVSRIAPTTRRKISSSRPA
jgi:hypothetical protein